MLSLINIAGKTILDVGCGAGNLALLAGAREGIVYASDLMPEAVRAAKENASALNIEVDVRKSDSTRVWEKEGIKFDIIICNPPCLERLASLSSSNLDVLHNSFLIVDLMKTYRKSLNRKGCFMSVVSGKENIEWVKKKFREDHVLEPLVIHKRPLMEEVGPDKIDALLRDRLVIRRKGKLYWDAYYFCAFHI
jgi:methylase of polypeptide subunit release factors